MGVEGSNLTKFSRISWYLMEKGGERQHSWKMILRPDLNPTPENTRKQQPL